MDEFQKIIMRNDASIDYENLPFNDIDDYIDIFMHEYKTDNNLKYNMHVHIWQFGLTPLHSDIERSNRKRLYERVKKEQLTSSTTYIFKLKMEKLYGRVQITNHEK